MITSKKDEFDHVLSAVLIKIDAGTITCEDLNELIGKTMIGESTPESVRDRVRRRVKRNETDSHIEPETGHQPLAVPTLADRVQPKIKPMHQQNHGRTRIAHDHSARTQSENLQSAIEFINTYQGKLITDDILKDVSDHKLLVRLATRLMAHPNVDRNWLYELVNKLDKS